MKNLVEKVLSAFKKSDVAKLEASKANNEPSIVGNWRLIGYTGHQDEEIKPHWKEIWSFAAMDETEVNGIYVCDYINLHSIVGKWEVLGKCIKLIRKELVQEYNIEELTSDRLQLKAVDRSNILSSISFKREV